MEIKPLALSDMQTGLNINIQMQRYMAAAEAVGQTQAEYIAALRTRMGLGQEWQLHDWLVGFVKVDSPPPGGTNGN